MMKRIELVVSYDGTNYCGWQRQPNGITVQQVLEEKLSLFLHEKISLIGASRTDAGVHALGNRAVFDTDTQIPPEKICLAINKSLPPDIVVQSSREVPVTFHPRKCSSRKTYEYRILNARMPLPTKRLTSCFVYYPLDLSKMQEASRALRGRHDFKSFCAAHSSAVDTVREIYSLDFAREGDEIVLTVCGNGFLYNMVRIMAGTLIEVGKGNLGPDQTEKILAAKNRAEAGPTAPACGLTLVKIEYEKDPCGDL